MAAISRNRGPVPDRRRRWPLEDPRAAGYRLRRPRRVFEVTDYLLHRRPVAVDPRQCLEHHLREQSGAGRVLPMNRSSRVGFLGVNTLGDPKRDPEAAMQRRRGRERGAHDRAGARRRGAAGPAGAHRRLLALARHRRCSRSDSRTAGFSSSAMPRISCRRMAASAATRASTTPTISRGKSRR